MRVNEDGGRVATLPLFSLNAKGLIGNTCRYLYCPRFNLTTS